MTARPARALRLLLSALLAATALAVVPAPATAATVDPWIDTAFGVGGTARTAFAGEVQGVVVDAVRMPDGDVMVLVDPAHTFWGCCTADVGSWSLVRLAPDGTPRAGFGTGGVIQPALSATSSSLPGLRPVALEPDAAGRLLLLGSLQVAGKARSVVVRLTGQGQVDTSYGSAGMTVLGTSTECWASQVPFFADLVIGSTGGAVVVGSCSDAAGGAFRAVVARLLPSGAADTAFGASGLRTLPLPGVGACCGPTLARAADGRLVVGLGSSDAAFLRLSAAGVPDPTFGGDGVVVVPDRSGGDQVVPLADGSLLWSAGNAQLARLDASGAPDPTYGGPDSAGTVRLPEPDPCSYGEILGSVPGSGGAVLAVSCIQSTGLVRLSADGAVDSGYGVVGTGAFPSDAHDVQAGRRMLLADGSGVLVLGVDAGSGVRVERRTATGALDTAYGTDGVTTVHLTGRWFSVDSPRAGYDALGRLVVAARVDNRGMADENGLVVVRHLVDGRLDQSFGDGGRAHVDLGGFRPGRYIQAGESVQSLSLLVRDDGSALTVALWENELAYEAGAGTVERGLLVVGLTADGRPDTAIGPGGRRLLDLPGVDLATLGGIARGTDGTVLVGITRATPDGDGVAVVRLLADGSLDGAYGSGGVRALADTARGGNPELRVVPAGPSAVLLAWAGYTAQFDDELVLARMSLSGVLDAGFGTGGRVRVPGEFQAVTATAAGKPLVARELRDPGGGSSDAVPVQLRRYLATGEADTAFGSNGVAVVPSATTASVSAYDRLMALGVDGERPVLLIRRNRASAVTSEVQRVTATGALDATYGTGSVVRLAVETSNVFGLGEQLLVRPTGQVDVVHPTYGATSSVPRDLEVIQVRAGVVRLAALPQVTLAAGAVASWPGSTAGPYTVETRRAPLRGGFAGWASVPVGGATASSVAVPRGTTTCVRVRTADGQTSSTGCVAAPAPASTMKASKGWRTARSSAYFAGAARTSSRRGATLTLTKVQARRIAVVAERCRTCGAVDVLWNGSRVARLSFVGSRKHAVVHPLPAFSSTRTGTLTLRVVSRKGKVAVSGVAGWRSDA